MPTELNAKDIIREIAKFLALVEKSYPGDRFPSGKKPIKAVVFGLGHAILTFGKIFASTSTVHLIFENIGDIEQVHKANQCCMGHVPGRNSAKLIDYPNDWITSYIHTPGTIERVEKSEKGGSMTNLFTGSVVFKSETLVIYSVDCIWELIHEMSTYKNNTTKDEENLIPQVWTESTKGIHLDYAVAILRLIVAERKGIALRKGDLERFIGSRRLSMTLEDKVIRAVNARYSEKYCSVGILDDDM